MRTIPLFDPLRAALWGKHGLLLTTGKGVHMMRVGLRRKWASYLRCLEEIANGDRNRRWYGMTKDDLAMIEAGGALPPWREVHIRTHDFRHSFATMLWEADVDLKTTMKWMGHADQTMILKVYAHLMDKRSGRRRLRWRRRSTKTTYGHCSVT